MKNLLIKTLLISFLLAVFSCTTEDNNDPSYNTRVLLKSITYSGGAIYEYYENNKCQYDIFDKYQYDTKGRLSKATNPSNSNSYDTYFYNEDGTIKTIYYYSSSTTYTRYEFLYSTNNIQANIYSSTNPNVISSRLNFLLTNGRISSYNQVGTVGTVNFTYDTNGNILSKIASGYSQSAANFSISSTFDNKFSPMALKLKGFFGESYLNNSILAGIFDSEMQVNNFLTKRSIFSTSSFIYSFTYSYNAQNYPLSRTDNNGNKLFYNYDFSK